MLSEDGQLSRKKFLKAIAILGLSSCAPFYTKSRFIHLLTNDPHPDHYNPIIDALINIILPFDHPEFPDINTLTVRQNIDYYFPLTESRYEPFQRAFIIFNDIQLFSKKLPAIIDDESKLFKEFEELNNHVIQSKINKFLELDNNIFQKFEIEFGKYDTFLQAPKTVQSAYLNLWAQSSFTIRRMFFNSAKGLINACAYCQKEVWDVIGYDGHFNEKG